MPDNKITLPLALYPWETLAYIQEEIYKIIFTQALLLITNMDPNKMFINNRIDKYAL